MEKNRKYCSGFNPDASETVAYNNPLFPAYVRYGVLSTYPDYSAISHWHRDLEFILIRKGGMTYNVNGELIDLTEGNGILVNSRQFHYGFSAEHQECEFICILLSPELMQGNEWFCQNCVDSITENSAWPYLYLEASGWQGQILEKLNLLYRAFGDSEPDTASCFTVMEVFASILGLLYKNLNVGEQRRGKESAELDALRRMTTYIEEHISERISLEDIAQAGACCRARCASLFKKYLRDTPVTYTTKLRLRRSLSALLDSDRSITDIALEYGFCGASYYCETFRKYYGMSPLQYRKAGEE